MSSRQICNNMKKIIVLLALTFLFVTPAYANEDSVTTLETTSTKAEKIKRIEEREVKVTQKYEKVVASLKERAIKEIDRRITSLSGLIEKINSFKKLSSSQKSTMTSQIQSEITNLTTLKNKINADTDTATLKTDVQSIVKGFRIYALFIPKIHILAAADGIDSVADNMSTVAAKLETRINESTITDKTVVNQALSDLRLKIASAKTQAQNARNAVIPLTPDGFPTNKTTLQSARAMIVAGTKDLKAAREDMRKIAQILKGNSDKIKDKNLEKASKSAIPINKRERLKTNSKEL